MKKEKLDREKVFTERPKPKFLWCMHCERAYKYGEFRKVENLQLCPYDGCEGDTVVDAYDWNNCRKDEDPEIPKYGEFYPAYR